MENWFELELGTQTTGTMPKCSLTRNTSAFTILSAGWGAMSIGTNLFDFCASFPFSNCGRFSSVGRALDYRVGGRGFDSRGVDQYSGLLKHIN